MVTELMERRSSLYAICLMLLNMASLAVLDISGKILRGSMSSAHIVFCYKLLCLIAVLPWVLRKGAKGLKTTKIHIHFIRSILSVTGTLFFINGLHYVKMSDAAALENLQSIALALIGIVFFKETATRAKLIAIITGFFGAIIVVNPQILNLLSDINDINDINLATYYFTLMGLAFWVLNSVTVKVLGRTESNITQMFYLLLFACIWTAPAALVKWENIEFIGMKLSLIPVSLIDLNELYFNLSAAKLLIIMSLCQFVHGFSYFKALKKDLSTVEPLRYSKLVFSALLGHLIFSEQPSVYSLVGYCLIVLSGLVLLKSEISKSHT